MGGPWNLSIPMFKAKANTNAPELMKNANRSEVMPGELKTTAAITRKESNSINLVIYPPFASHSSSLDAGSFKFGQVKIVDSQTTKSESAQATTGHDLLRSGQMIPSFIK
jgi:hypothetical protein